MAPAPHLIAGGRFDEDGGWIARQFFTPDDLRLPPEEYVARHAHEWGCFSFHLYRYDDAELGAWVRRVGELLSAEGEVDRCRQRFLNANEFADVLRQVAAGF